MPYMLAIVFAVGLMSGGGLAWKAASLHYEHIIDVAALDAAAAVADANLDAYAAAMGYEEVKTKQRARAVVVTREVEREVHADLDCSARAIPSGLRGVLARAAADAGQSIAHGPMPAASAAAAGDLGGSGSGLRGPVDGAGGLRSAPRSTQ